MRLIRPALLAWLFALSTALCPLRAAPVAFSIPAQPAPAALMAFARQSGIDVIFSSKDLQDVQCSAVSGTLEPSAALERLLEGTGCVARRAASGRLTVRRVRAPRESTPPAPTLRPGEQTPSGVVPGAVSGDDIVTLADLVVTPSRFGIADGPIAREATLTSRELEALPQLGEDLYRTINTRMPGLASDDLSAMFWVRGAPHHEVLSRFDGVDLLEPFHLKDYDGAISIVDLDTIESMDLTTGGFTADYGDRLTGVIDIATQSDPGADRRTTLGLSVMHMRATSQGRFADGDGQWLATARRGYVDLALELAGQDVDESPTYYDLSGKIAYRIAPNHTLSLHVLHAGDTFESDNDGEEDEPDLRSRYTSSYLWGRWLGRFGDRLSGEAVLAGSRLEWARDGDGLVDYILPMTLRDRRQLQTIGLRNDWSLVLDENLLLRAGLDLSHAECRYDYELARTYWTLGDGVLGTAVRTIDEDFRPDADRLSLFLAPRIRLWDRLTLEPGLRYDDYSHLDDSAWSPRLNVAVDFGATMLRAAWGDYHQAHGVHELSVGDGETLFQQVERAEQRVLGISHRLRNGVSLRLEGYERLIANPRTHWENLLDPTSLFPEAADDRVRVDPTRGRARGVELTAERRGDRFGWSASYSYARSEERVNGAWLPRQRDQEHTFYADISFRPARHWMFSAAWTFHTGWPVTDIHYDAVTLADGRVIPVPRRGPMNALRAPDYHRLDFRASRTFQLSQGTLRVFVDLFNVYSRRNEYGFDEPYGTIENGHAVEHKEPLKMFPMLPSFGVTWEF